MSTEFPSKPGIRREWHLLDADNVVLGKLAGQAAMLLMGKHKPTYTPFLDTGDHVIVVNAAKVKLTGKKDDQKMYRRFTGYPGGLVEVGARKMRATRPTPMVEGDSHRHGPRGIHATAEKDAVGSQGRGDQMEHESTVVTSHDTSTAQVRLRIASY